MALTPRHRGQDLCWCLTHVERTSVVRTGSGDPWPDSVGGRGVGVVTAPRLNFTLRRLAISGGRATVPLPEHPGAIQPLPPPQQPRGVQRVAPGPSQLQRAGVSASNQAISSSALARMVQSLSG